MTALCSEPQSRCLCILPSGHETPHVCECSGSWREAEEELVVYSLPPFLNPYLTTEEALEKANEYARRGELFREPKDSPPLRVSREPIKYLRVPPQEGQS